VYGGMSSRLKRARRETDHSSPSSAEVKNARIYTRTPPYAISTQEYERVSKSFRTESTKK
jgi:hypothetical protein